MKISLIYQRLLQLLIFTIAILGGTNFNQFQIFSETLLIVILLFSIRRKLSIIEILLMLLYFFVSFVSFFYNDNFVFLLNFKIFFIPLLILIYYKNKIVDLLIINLFFFLNILLILYQIVFGKFIFDISGIVSNSFKDEIVNRPLGLFLNFHFSAFFTAICLIYYFFNKNYIIKFASSFIVALSGSFFTLFSYFLSFFNKYLLFIFSLFFIFIYLSLSLNDYLINFSKQGSLLVILYQLFDLDRYKVLSFFPQDYSAINSNWYKIVDANSYARSRILLENEIQFFTYLIQGGILYATIFIIYYLKKVNNFAIFLFIAMLHYGYALNPLTVLLTVGFQNRINQLEPTIHAQS